MCNKKRSYERFRETEARAERAEREAFEAD